MAVFLRARHPECRLVKARFLLWKCLIVWLGIRQIAQEKTKLRLQIRESHYDNCGGLRVLAHLWLNVSCILAMLGFYVIGWAVFVDGWRNPASTSGAAIYFAVVPASFLGVFFSLHSAMAKHKNKTLLEREAELNAIQEQLLETMNSTKRLGRNIPILKAEHDFLNQRRLPTWPLDAGMWRAFFISMCLL